MSARRWYIGQQGRQLGPYRESILKTLAENQKLRREDLLWTEGMGDWARADAVAELGLFPNTDDPAPEAAVVAQAAAQASSAPTDPAVDTQRIETADSQRPDSTSDGQDQPSHPLTGSNYFLRHWRGELALPVAYWVNMVLLSIPVFMLSAWINSSSSGLEQASARSHGLVILGMLLFVVVFCLWQIVGVLRSAHAYPARGGSRGWARTAQVLAVLGLLRLLGTLIQEFPIIRESTELLVQGDTMLPSTLRVLNHATEVEVSGGLALGTAQKLRTLLEATPTIRIVQLNNIGGWISEGAAIEKLIEDRGLSTYTRGKCVSACLLAFMGGQERFLASHGQLGFHQASVSGVGGAVAAEGDARFRHVFASKGLPSYFIDHALTTPPQSMWYPTQQELLDAHVVTAIVNERDYGTTGVANWKNEAALKKEFEGVPVYAALQQLDPALFAQMRGEFVSGVRQGVSEAEMARTIRAILIQKVIPKYLPLAPDAQLLAYWRVQLTEMRELRARGPKYCTMFLFPAADTPDLSPMLSRDTGAADIEKLGELLNGVAQTPAAVPSAQAVQSLLVNALRSAEQQDPGSIARVSDPDKWKSRPRELCDAELAFYDALLALPQKQAGPVLRFLMARAFSSTKGQQTSAAR